MTPAEFRVALPEFASTTNYPDVLVSRHIAIAVLRLNVDRWYDLYDTGMQLFVAHYITIARRNAIAAAAGGVPGAIVAPVSTKTVDKVSVSYDTTAVIDESAGQWNATSYGVQYWELARMVGAGGFQL